jgi:hypothetical protein
MLFFYVFANASEIRDFGLTLRGKHLFHRRLDIGSVLDPKNMHKDFLGERIKEIAKNKMISGKTNCIGWIWSHGRLLLFVWIIDSKLLGRRGICAVEQSCVLSTTDRRQNLRSP